MNYLIFFILFIPTFAHALCEEFATSTNPTQTLPSSWADVTESGAYATPAIDGVWVDVHVSEYSDGTLCTQVDDPYPKRYCTITSNGDDPDTPEIEPYSIRAVFSQTNIIECPQYYSYDRYNNICVLIEPDLCEPEFCSDGSPIVLEGYPASCDRPELRQCLDGTWIEMATEFCPEDSAASCSDYQTCLDFAVGNTVCSEGNEITFIYIDPENYSTECVAQQPDSPDLVENGGNGDGNPYNDPGITPLPDGTTPTVSEVDPSQLVDAIDSVLRDDFSNVERAVRDGTDQVVAEIQQQTTDRNDNEDSNTDLINQRLDQLIQEQQQTTGAIEDQTFQQSMNNETGNGNGPCDPTMPDYVDCLSATTQALPAHQTTPTFSESLSQLYDRIQNSQLVTGLLSITNIVQLSPGQCVDFGFIFPLNNEYISTDIHCQVGESIRPILSVIMLVVWTIIGFKIFVSA